mmetsp:Transcript_130683/g.364119  ORF Transcript_130683/g.364119 Transcript_130683/m.364119 type:complete len:315 (+) Transcript_130683:210-1154(+)
MAIAAAGIVHKEVLVTSNIIPVKRDSLLHDEEVDAWRARRSCQRTLVMPELIAFGKQVFIGVEQVRITDDAVRFEALVKDRGKELVGWLVRGRIVNLHSNDCEGSVLGYMHQMHLNRVVVVVKGVLGHRVEMELDELIDLAAPLHLEVRAIDILAVVEVHLPRVTLVVEIAVLAAAILGVERRIVVSTELLVLLAHVEVDGGLPLVVCGIRGLLSGAELVSGLCCPIPKLEGRVAEVLGLADHLLSLAPPPDLHLDHGSLLRVHSTALAGCTGIACGDRKLSTEGVRQQRAEGCGAHRGHRHSVGLRVAKGKLL